MTTDTIDTPRATRTGVRKNARKDTASSSMQDGIDLAVRMLRACEPYEDSPLCEGERRARGGQPQVRFAQQYLQELIDNPRMLDGFAAVLSATLASGMSGRYAALNFDLPASEYQPGVPGEDGTLAADDSEAEEASLADAEHNSQSSPNHGSLATAVEASAQVREWLDQLVQGLQEAQAPQWERHSEAASLLGMAIERLGAVRTSARAKVLDECVTGAGETLMEVDALLAGAEAIGCAKPQIAAMRALCDQLHGLLDQPGLWPQAHSKAQDSANAKLLAVHLEALAEFQAKLEAAVDVVTQNDQFFSWETQYLLGVVQDHCIPALENELKSGGNDAGWAIHSIEAVLLFCDAKANAPAHVRRAMRELLDQLYDLGNFFPDTGYAAGAGVRCFHFWTAFPFIGQDTPTTTSFRAIAMPTVRENLAALDAALNELEDSLTDQQQHPWQCVGLMTTTMTYLWPTLLLTLESQTPECAAQWTTDLEAVLHSLAAHPDLPEHARPRVKAAYDALHRLVDDLAPAAGYKPPTLRSWSQVAAESASSDAQQRLLPSHRANIVPLELAVKALAMQAGNDASFCDGMDYEDMHDLVNQNIVLRDAAVMYIEQVQSEIREKGLEL